MTELDASAVLAFVHDEPGADLVANELSSASLGAANLAEVIGRSSSTPTSTSAGFVSCSPPSASRSSPFLRRTPN